MKRSMGRLAGLLAGGVLVGAVALAFPADGQAPTGVLAGKPRKAPPQQGGDEGEQGEPPVDPKTMECVAQCQQPAMRCMSQCGQDMKCSAQCAERLHRCGQKCGLKIPEDP